MNPDFAAAIDALLSAKGLSRRAASLKLGKNEHFLRDWLRGKVQSPAADTLKKLAELLEVPVDVLIASGVEETPATTYDHRDLSVVSTQKRRTPRVAALPVLHRVQAGAWLETDDTAQAQRVGPPVSYDYRIGGEQWVEEVVGDSMDKVAPEGSFVHVVSFASIQSAPIHGDRVVIERIRAQGGLRERSLKRVVEGKGNVLELWPESTNPRWREPLRIRSDGISDSVEIEVEVVGRVIGVYRVIER